MWQTCDHVCVGAESVDVGQDVGGQMTCADDMSR